MLETRVSPAFTRERVLRDQPSIILIEDDEKLAQLLLDYFSHNQFAIEHLSSDNQVFDKIIQAQPDVLLLDLRLPFNDGLYICRQIRQQYQGKILMFTASGDDIDQVTAIELGVDDFVQKPIQPRVLLARIKMLLRRVSSAEQVSTSQPGTQELHYGRLWINQNLRRCQLDEALLDISNSEFNLLWELASHAYKVLSRDQLTLIVTGKEFDGLNRTIDNKIVQLRKKLGDNAARPKGLITVRGKGYMFVPDFWQ